MEVIILGGISVIIYVFYRLKVKRLKDIIEDIHKNYKEFIKKAKILLKEVIVK